MGIRAILPLVLFLFLVLLVVLLGLLSAWVAATGFYVLQPGEAAVILRLGRYAYTD